MRLHMAQCIHGLQSIRSLKCQLVYQLDIRHVQYDAKAYHYVRSLDQMMSSTAHRSFALQL